MIHRDIMSPQKAIKAILVLSLVVLVGIVLTLHILPKGIAWGSACVGIKLDSSDLGTKFGMVSILNISNRKNAAISIT